MKRPWKETWTFGVDDAGEHIALPPDAGSFEPVVRGPWTHRGQVLLASAAPEMARLLLALEWRGGDELAWCPSCCGLKHPMGREPAGHTSDCAWLAAARKAGLR